MNDKTKIKTDGTTINQPRTFMVAEQPFHKAPGDAILRTGNKALLRKFAQQRINSILRKGGTPDKLLISLATRHSRKGN